MEILPRIQRHPNDLLAPTEEPTGDVRRELDPMPDPGQERIIAGVVHNSWRNLAFGALALFEQDLTRGTRRDIEQFDPFDPVLQAQGRERSDRFSGFQREPVIALAINRTEIIRLPEKEFPAE